MIARDDHKLFAELLQRSKRFVLTTHMNPDGDAIGSEIGLSRFLAARGNEVRMVNQDPTPGNLRFIEDAQHHVEVFDEGRHGQLLADADLIVLLDNSATDRLGRMEAPMRSLADRVLCIDHHPTRVTPWSHDILDQQACATAGMVYDLTGALGWTPDKRAADALFVGLATDTGFFRFNSTTARAYEIAADLMRAGVDPARCYQEIYERNSAAFTRLLGHALVGLRLAAGGAVAAVSITLDQVQRCAAEQEDTSEMTTALLAMDRVSIAILFRELEERRVKVSLRSKGRLDVRRLATQFGGGGHRNASGIVFDGSLREAEELVMQKAAALVEESRAG